MRFEAQSFKVHKCSSYETALRSVEKKDFDLAIVDQGSLTFEGRWVIKHLIRYSHDTPFIVLARRWDMECYLQALELGAVHYLEKPVSTEEMNRIIHNFFGISYSRRKSLRIKDSHRPGRIPHQERIEKHTQCFTCSRIYFDELFHSCPHCGSATVRHYNSEELNHFSREPGREAHVEFTELAERSTPIPVLQQQMRHADVRTSLKVYAHAIPQSQRDAIEQISIGTNVPIGTESNS